MDNLARHLGTTELLGKYGRITNNELGRALIQQFVLNIVDQMPHQSCINGDGCRENQLMIPDLYKQVDILHEINMALKNMH